MLKNKKSIKHILSPASKVFCKGENFCLGVQNIIHMTQITTRKILKTGVSKEEVHEFYNK